MYLHPVQRKVHTISFGKFPSRTLPIIHYATLKHWHTNPWHKYCKHAVFYPINDDNKSTYKYFKVLKREANRILHAHGDCINQFITHSWLKVKFYENTPSNHFNSEIAHDILRTNLYSSVALIVRSSCLLAHS